MTRCAIPDVSLLVSCGTSLKPCMHHPGRELYEALKPKLPSRLKAANSAICQRSSLESANPQQDNVGLMNAEAQPKSNQVAEAQSENCQFRQAWARSESGRLEAVDSAKVFRASAFPILTWIQTWTFPTLNLRLDFSRFEPTDRSLLRREG